MKCLFLLTIFTSFLFTSFSQTNTRQFYHKLSGGRVSFGTGDFFGYSVSYEASKNVIRKPSFALNRLLLGGELIFENGVKNPVIDNPTFGDFIGSTFHHVSSTILWAKASYYPFNKIIRGFNIQAGPTFGYSYRSTESRSSRIVQPNGQATRSSTLSFDNGFTVGYRISTGIEFNVSKKFLTGFRLDFSNNNDADVNTLLGVKIGLRL